MFNYVMFIICTSVATLGIFKILEIAYNTIYDSICKYRVNYARSSDFNYTKDIQLLANILKECCDRHIQTHILGGRRLESIMFDQIAIPYDYDVMDKHITQIKIAVIGLLSKSYIDRIRNLYIAKIEDYIELQIKDQYIGYINKLVDAKAISAIDKIKKLENENKVSPKEAILNTLLGSVVNKDELERIVNDFARIPIKRLESLKENSISEYSKVGSRIALDLIESCNERNVKLDDMISYIKNGGV